jgi:hypothetical protein
VPVVTAVRPPHQGSAPTALGYNGSASAVDALVRYFRHPVELPLSLDGLGPVGLAVVHRRLLIRLALLVR